LDCLIALATVIGRKDATNIEPQLIPFVSPYAESWSELGVARKKSEDLTLSKLGDSDCRREILERLDALHHLAKRMVKLPVLSDTSSENGFEVSEIGNVDDLINTLHESAHGIVGGKSMAQ
jgi:hypothetical protein